MMEDNQVWMGAEEYIDKRLTDQINWYSRKSSSCQFRYKLLRFVEVFSASLIPFLSGIGGSVPYFQWVVGILGVIIALSIAANGLLKYQDYWFQYRVTSEQLKHEKFLFVTKTAPYDEADALQKLVQTVESLISKEVTAWTQMAKNTKTDKKTAKCDAC